MFVGHIQKGDLGEPHDDSEDVVEVMGDAASEDAKTLELLRVLALHAQRVLSRDQLEQHLYSWGQEVDSNAVEVHIHHLRRKLGSGSILTMRGVGYFIPQEAA